MDCLLNISIQVRFMRFVITHCWQVCRYCIQTFKQLYVYIVHVHADANICWIWETAFEHHRFCLLNLRMDILLLRWHNEYSPIIYCFHYGIFGLLSFNCRLFSEKREEVMERANEVGWKVENQEKRRQMKENEEQNEGGAKRVWLRLKLYRMR